MKYAENYRHSRRPASGILYWTMDSATVTLKILLQVSILWKH